MWVLYSNQTIYGKSETILWCSKKCERFKSHMQHPRAFLCKKSSPIENPCRPLCKGDFLVLHHNFLARGFPHGPGAQSYTPPPKTAFSPVAPHIYMQCHFILLFCYFPRFFNFMDLSATLNSIILP